MDHSLQKAAQRKAGIAARRALSAAARSAADAALCRRIAALHCFRNARPLLAYAAFGGEADLSALLAEAVRQGKTVAYPICGAGFTLTAAVPGPDGWEVGAYGIRTPIPERAQLLPPEALDLVLVPCTAVGAACRRNAVLLGTAFEAQRVEQAAVDAHDQRLDGFVTEERIYRGTDEFEL